MKVVKNKKYKTNKVHKCSWCDDVFDKRMKLKKHIKLVHTEMCQKSKKHIPCDQCNKLYSNEISLARHKKQIHQGIRKEKTELCNLCPMKYQFKAQLQHHINVVHEGIKEFSCEVCGENFARADVLRRHIAKIHTKQRISGFGTGT